MCAMRAPLAAWAALAICAVIPIAIYFTVQLTVGNDADTSAREHLTQFSRRANRATYTAQYGGRAADGEVSREQRIAVYRQAGVPPYVRFDLPEPIEFDDDGLEDILRGGDILILNPDEPSVYISCRTARNSCRTADGLERLAFVSYLVLFSYPEPAPYKQPHSVRQLPDDTIAGEHASCFEVVEPDPLPEQPPGLGVVIGEGLPAILCYADDGVPLRYGEKQDEGVVFLDAFEVTRAVPPGTFDLPFPFVPSVYDE
jgi:hypothetical protein